MTGRCESQYYCDIRNEVFDFVGQNKTDGEGGVFQPLRTGATMVAVIVGGRCRCRRHTSSRDVEERTIETKAG